MDLSVIIVSWNVKEKLRENLKAIFKSAGTRNFAFEVFVVDNNSADNTVEMIKKEFPKVKLIANKENLGFAKANNQAINQARGNFILLLNPDMRVMPDTLEKMIKWMIKNKQATVAGCHLVDEQGKTIKHVRRFPTAWNQLAIVLKLPHIFSNILNRYLRTDFDYSKAQKVDSIRGGFFMIRTSPPTPLLIRRGERSERRGEVLDEQYFLWFEEVDFCKQIVGTRHGAFNGEVWYTPVAQCIDYVGQSFKQLSRGKAQKYFRDSMLKYFKKWHPVWQYWLLKTTWPVGMLLTWILVKLNYKSNIRT
ncbi:glycosyltransferase family 2 protein [Candidatus Parcubacteria bacterium]|nr:glycosyltransferase family 2 protein [Candidatus Parcubacteria bacterium]